VKIDSFEPKMIYIPWGVGHGFLSLEDNTTFVYLCDQRYNPSNEFDLNAFDPELKIEWPQEIEIVRSEKDYGALNLSQIQENLPE
jgi:dTDP-4-dehydrorhamnose 3,5-epimerase-like enzyme